MPNGRRNDALMVITAEDGVILSVNMSESEAKKIRDFLDEFIQAREGDVGTQDVNWNS